MRKILITGGSGFIGKELVSKLSKLKDISIDILYRNNITKIPNTPNIRYLKISNFDTSEIEYDVFVHLAAFITASRDKLSTINLIESNILFGSELLAEIKLKPGGLFIDTGSFAELHTSNNSKVSYLYAETKKSFENIAKFFASINEYNYCKVYPYTVISEERQDKKLLDIMLSAIDSILPVKMSSGEQVLDFISRDDVVSMYELLILESNFNKLNNKKIECCSGKGTSVIELAKMIETISGKRLNIDWGALPYRETDIMNAVGSTKNAKNLLGWKPSESLNDTLKKIIA